jgi:hypothetical protein
MNSVASAAADAVPAPLRAIGSRRCRGAIGAAFALCPQFGSGDIGALIAAQETKIDAAGC